MSTVLPTSPNTKSPDNDSSDDDSSDAETMKYADTVTQAKLVIQDLPPLPPKLTLRAFKEWRTTVGNKLSTIITPRTGTAGLSHLVDTQATYNNRCNTTGQTVPKRAEEPAANADATTKRMEMTQYLIELSVDKMLVDHLRPSFDEELMKDYGDGDVLPNTYTSQQALARIRATIATPDALLEEQDEIKRELMNMPYTHNKQGATAYFRQQITLMNTYNALKPIKPMDKFDIMGHWPIALGKCGDITAESRTTATQKWKEKEREYQDKLKKKNQWQDTEDNQF